jgi:hypothetical protein
MDEQYVIDLYRQVLGREPDPAGLAHNLGLLQSGAVSASDLAGAFAGSQEAQSSPTANPSAAPSYSPSSGGGDSSSAPSLSDAQAKAQVAQLYQNILGRSPDAGAKGWENLLLAGYDISEVARQIGTSQEAQNRAVANISPEIRANDPNNFAGSVTQLYASALGRTPDAATLEANINLLNRDPDAFGWLANSVTSSPEARAYADKSGVDLNKAYENVVGNFEHFTPTPRQGGLAGFANQYGYLAPFLLAGGALAAPYLLGAGAAGAGAGAGAAGAGGSIGGIGLGGAFVPTVGSGASFALPGALAAGAAGAAGAGAGSLEAYLASAGLNPGTFAGSGFALPGFGLSVAPEVASALNTANTALPAIPGAAPYTPSAFGTLTPPLTGSGAVAGGMSTAIPGVGLTGALPAGVMVGNGTLGTTMGATYMAAGPGQFALDAMGNAIPASSIGIDGFAPPTGMNLTDALSSLGNILKTPLGQLGAMGGLSLLGGGAQQQPVPQMAGGGGTYAPRGQVDYRPIIDLLAPRQISRTSLLG